MLSPIRPKAGEYGALVCMSAWADAGVGKDEGCKQIAETHICSFFW